MPSKTLPRLRRLLVLGVTGERRELVHFADGGRETITRACIGIERERDGRDAALICFEVKIDGDAVDMVYGADEIFYLTLVAVYELQ